MSRFVDDSAELARLVTDEVERLIEEYWPQAIKARVKGQQIALLTPRQKGKQKRPTSSFTVNLSGDRRGQWYRFSQSIGGGALALLHYGKHGYVPNSKSDWAETYRLAREFLGITQQREETEEERADREAQRARDTAARDQQNRQAAEARARKEAARTYSANEVWAETRPLQGTQGEAYLVGRGIPPIEHWPWDCGAIIRFHPSLDYELDRAVGRLPAVVASVLDPFGKLIAVWQIYLDRTKATKAPVENAKVGRGPAAGGAVRIGGDAERVGACEGVETGLGLWALEGFRMPMWSMLSTSGMTSFEPPMFVKRISIFHDGDKGIFQNGKILKPPGTSAADTLAGRMAEIGVATNRNEMPILGDGLDLLQTRNEIDRKKQIA
ncbi:toprim domain-containing protein [Shinella zoogloeoides]|uniref:DUF7146 domain-containing protein n=1 Tax=Shinella zoogloeoides TaxID=352475 RepID=UPI00299D1E39|nr:toprim domain-containing protein [Shinella zoogloeoides]WPE19894.1 hypothetical protein ShzoTeo12_10700 [Shinella zoogloeoides]